MRVIPMFVAMFLAVGCEGVYTPVDTRTGSSAPDDDGSDGDSGSSSDPIHMEKDCYDGWNCLFVDGSILGNETFAAIVGVYYGNPGVDPDDLEVEDLDTTAFREDAGIGWGMECDNSEDIGHAVSTTNGGYRFPLGAIIVGNMEQPFPSGVYRTALRKLNTLYDANDFEEGTVIVDCDGLADPGPDSNWSKLTEGELGVWHGDDEDGNDDIYSIVFLYDADFDTYDLSWADRLPYNLNDL